MRHQFLKSASPLLVIFLAFATVATGVPTEASLKDRIIIRKKGHWELTNQAQSRDFNAVKEDGINLRRESLIKQLTHLYAATRSSGTRVEIGIRLGKLYREKFYYQLQKSYRTFQRQIADEKDSKSVARLGTPNDVEAKVALDHAIKVFGVMVPDTKNSRRDQVLYYYATSNLERGNTSQAMDAFKELLEKFPRSSFAVEALVELGDHNFDLNKYPEAEGYYDQVIGRKYAPLLSYATYKKAWCAYNQGRKELSLSLFKWVIQNEEKLASSRLHIRNEALHDIPLPFVDLHRFDESVAFFQAFPEPIYRAGLDTMAQLYAEAGEHVPAIRLWENLLSLDSNYAKAPEYELKIVASQDLKNDHRGAVKRLVARAPLYMPGTEWWKANTPATKNTSDSQNLFEQAFHKYAMGYHATGQKVNNEEYYELAKKLYVKYLALFPTSSRAGQVHFFLAEIQMRSKQYLEASNNYHSAYKTMPEGEDKRDALRRALSALDLQLNTDRQDQGLAVISNDSSAPLKGDGDEQKFSDTEARFMAMCDEYLKAYPKASDAPNVLFEQAYLQYTHRDFEHALASFNTLLVSYPRHETAYTSARLTLDIFNRQGDYDRLVFASKKMLATPTLSQAGFRSEVASILRHTELKRVQATEAKGEFQAAAEGYLSYIKDYGYQDEALFETALYNTTVDYGKANMLSQQIENQEKFLHRFPKSKLAEPTMLALAKAYESVSNFEKAAPLFERLANKYPQNAQAKNALHLAGLYYMGAGNYNRSESVMKDYLEKYPKEAATVDSDLMDLYASRGSVSRAIAYESEARAQKTIPAVEYVERTVKLAELKAQKSGVLSSKLMEEALDKAKEHSSQMKKSAKGIDRYSQLLFWQAEKDEHEFYAIHLRHPSPRIEKDLKRKLELLKDLEASYGKVVKLGSSTWGIGAIYKTAAAYRQLALDVVGAPIPASLNGKALDEYRAELKKSMIDPFNQKAASLASHCLEKAEEVRSMSNWPVRCYTMAAQLDPMAYPVVHTFYLPALQTALIVPPDAQRTVERSSARSETLAFPIIGSGLFSLMAPSRGLTAMALENPPLTDSVDSIFDDNGVAPTPTSYRALGDQRKTALARELDSLSGEGGKAAPSFAYLNLMRLVKPEGAVPQIQKALLADPGNAGLHNLLGLAYLEQHNYAAAKTVWLSMIARGIATPGVWNNLGVVSNLSGNEKGAMAYFNKAVEDETASEAFINLGFIALKYRGGAEAQHNFEKALVASENNPVATVGSWVAQLQQRRFDEARGSLQDLSQAHADDPYARLSAGYFLMDVDKQPGMAAQLLSTYMKAQSMENDVQFRRALNQANHLVNGSELATPPENENEESANADSAE